MADLRGGGIKKMYMPPLKRPQREVGGKRVSYPRGLFLWGLQGPFKKLQEREKNALEEA